MCCKERAENIALYAGDDLSESERVALEAHLAECAACREYLVEARALRSTLGALRDDAIDESAFVSLDQRLGRIPAAKHRKVVVQSALLAAGMLACLSMGLVALQFRDQPTSSVEQPTLARVEIEVVPSTRDETANVWRPSVAEETIPPKPDRVVAKLLTHDPNIVIILLASDPENETHANDKSVL